MKWRFYPYSKKKEHYVSCESKCEGDKIFKWNILIGSISEYLFSEATIIDAQFRHTGRLIDLLSGGIDLTPFTWCIRNFFPIRWLKIDWCTRSLNAYRTKKDEPSQRDPIEYKKNRQRLSPTSEPSSPSEDLVPSKQQEQHNEIGKCKF